MKKKKRRGKRKKKQRGKRKKERGLLAGSEREE
jgi:hypothetical protein